MFADIFREVHDFANVSQAHFHHELITKNDAHLPTERKINRMTHYFGSAWKGECPSLMAFSLCPSAHNGTRQADIVFALNETLRRFPEARIVVFSRSNLFRTAIASHGENFVKPECADEVRQTSFDVANFRCELPHIVAFRANLYGTAEDLQVPFRAVLFESLLADTRDTVEGLATWLGFDKPLRKALVESAVSRIRGGRSKHAPIVHDGCPADLPERSGLVLANASDLTAALDAFRDRLDKEGVAGGDCLAAMAKAANDEAFPYLIDFHASGHDDECDGKMNPHYACIPARLVAARARADAARGREGSEPATSRRG